MMRNVCAHPFSDMSTTQVCSQSGPEAAPLLFWLRVLLQDEASPQSEVQRDLEQDIFMDVSFIVASILTSLSPSSCC